MNKEDIENMMMENQEIKLNSRDLLIMRLVHYFITEQNYNPVILHGINDEIWLENLEKPYKIVRIVNHYIHNNEQLSLDKFKLRKILARLKTKTLTWKLKTFNIYTDLGDSVSLDNDNDFSSIYVKQLSDFENPLMLEAFPGIKEETKYQENDMELFLKITSDINQKNTKKSKSIEEIFSPKKPVITYFIMGICFLMFFLMYLLGDGSNDNFTLLKFGANFDLLTKSGEYFRLFSCIFLHAGIVHLLVNMYSLYIIGPQVESFFGKMKYLFIFLYSGFCGSVLSLAFSHNTISVGASGAIFGLLGALLYFGYHYRVYLGNVLKSQIIPIIIVNLLIGFMLTGIDNAAHIGGLIGGWIASMVVGVKGKNTKMDQINGIIIMLIYTIFIIYLGIIK